MSLDEARIAWHAAGTLGYPFGPLYRLILLTGCRPGEWTRCRSSYIDLKQSSLVIPAQADRSDHVHVVPLVPIAGCGLDEGPHQNDARDLCSERRSTRRAVDAA